jgi:hypothetical protein
VAFEVAIDAGDAGAVPQSQAEATVLAGTGPYETLVSGRSAAQRIIGLSAAAVTTLGILVVHPSSLVNFVYYFCIWNALILVLHREDLRPFSLAFLINSVFIAVFVVIQASVYPDTYGTTSPLSVSWTDDSYFFSLAADSFPADLLTRPNYWLYSHTFTSMIRAVTPLPIEHPLDVLFFQSGTAALLATFTRRLVLQWSGTPRVADTAYLLAVICPFLMMNGGVILLRDTFAAALLVHSLCCINAKRYWLAIAGICLQVSVRPGTGLILLPAYGIIYFSEILRFVRVHPLVVAGGATLFSVFAYALTPYLLDYFQQEFAHFNVGFLGREVFSDLTADPDSNSLFLAIQDLPFGIKLFVNAAYIFLYPFLNLRTVVGAEYFDLRNVTLSLIVPIYAFWLNAWFFAGALTATRTIDRQRTIVVAIVIILMLVGIYSLQSRHKTIIYPLYYIVIAVGFTNATAIARRCGYILSAALLLLEIAAVLR